MTRKIVFLDGWSWFKFNNFGLALGTNLKFSTSVVKTLKLKVRKFLELLPTFVESTREKLLRGRRTFWRPSSWIGLKAHWYKCEKLCYTDPHIETVPFLGNYAFLILIFLGYWCLKSAIFLWNIVCFLTCSIVLMSI